MSARRLHACAGPSRTRVLPVASFAVSSSAGKHLRLSSHLQESRARLPVLSTATEAFGGRTEKRTLFIRVGYARKPMPLAGPNAIPIKVVPHAHRPLESGPSADPSDTSESVRPGIELRHEAVNQPINRSVRTIQRQLTLRRGTEPIEPMPLTATNAISIKLVPHAPRPLESGSHAAPLTQRAGSHPGRERCGMASHGVLVRGIRH